MTAFILLVQGLYFFERFSGYNPHPATVLFARGINYRIYMG